MNFSYRLNFVLIVHLELFYLHLKFLNKLIQIILIQEQRLFLQDYNLSKIYYGIKIYRDTNYYFLSEYS